MKRLTKLKLTLTLLCLSFCSQLQADELKDNIQAYMNSWAIEQADARLAQIVDATSSDFSYTDPTTFEAGVTVTGHQALSDWIKGFHQSMKNYGLWPITVELSSNIDLQGKDKQTRKFRFTWRINAHNGQVLIAEGVDFGTADENNQVTSISGFFGSLLPICKQANWQAGTAYIGGEQVTHNGQTWQAKWWTKQEPSQQDTEQAESQQTWLSLGACANQA